MRVDPGEIDQLAPHPVDLREIRSATEAADQHAL
jgi:hypothetical protein